MPIAPAASLPSRREALEGVHGVERGRGHVPAGEQEDVEDEQDDDLADQPDREHHAGDPDVEVGQDADDQHHGQRQPGPGDAHPELVQLQAEEVGEAAGQRRLEHRVGDHRGVTRADAEFPAEPVADVGVEAARRGLLPCHCHVPDGEHHEHDRGEHERRRGADALAEADDDRRVEQHGRDRGRPGHGQEQDAAEPDRALAELGYVRALRDVEVLDRWPHGQAGNFGDLGLGHGTPPAHLRGA